MALDARHQTALWAIARENLKPEEDRRAAVELRLGRLEGRVGDLDTEVQDLAKALIALARVPVIKPDFVNRLEQEVRRLAEAFTAYAEKTTGAPEATEPIKPNA